MTTPCEEDHAAGETRKIMGPGNPNAGLTLAGNIIVVGKGASGPLGIFLP
jgi:hypothetical protein